MGSVEDGAFGDHQIVGWRKLGDKLRQKSRSSAFDEVAIDGETGSLFG